MYSNMCMAYHCTLELLYTIMHVNIVQCVLFGNSKYRFLLSTTDVHVRESELSPTTDGDSHSLHSVHSAHTSSHPSTPDSHRTERALCPTCRLAEPMDFVLRQTSTFPSPDACSRHDWARLNVGGRIFATTR